MKKILSLCGIVALVAACLFVLSACIATMPDTTLGEVDTSEIINVQIEMADGGIIKLELYPKEAPITCENFVALAKDGFYDGLISTESLKIS